MSTPPSANQPSTPPTTITRRDYRINGPEAVKAVQSGLAEAEWFRPPIDPERLRQLQRRGNARAALDTVAWLGLLTTSGYLAYRLWGSWWALPAFAAYGALYGGAGDSRWHECGHGTAFRSKWLNNVVYYLASFMLLRQPTLWRWSHVRHHTDTIVVGRDPEIIFPRPSSPAAVVLIFWPVVNVPKMVWRTAKHAVGRIDHEARSFIPAEELGKLRWESRAYIAILAGTVAWSLAAWTILPLLYIGLPTIYGAWLMIFFALTQHAGLREDVLDHRLNTRTVRMNPVFRFLYSNMNYHVEHHIFPTVPYYSLPALHQEVKDHLAPATSGTWAAYRDILSTLWRQWRDPTYDKPRKDIPEIPATKRSFVDTGFTVWAGELHDGLIDLGPAQDPPPGGVRRIDIGTNTYALYRLETGVLVCTDGLCTHGQAHLAEGAVIDCQVECPKHNGRFDLRTGEATRRPATAPLRLYKVSVRNGRAVSDLRPLPSPVPAESTR